MAQKILDWTKDDIFALREAVDVEFKKAAGKDGKGALPKDFWETYSAFANTDGGEIFLGIEEKSNGIISINGVQNTQQVIQDLFNLVNNRQKVSDNLLSDSSVEIIKIDNKLIIKVVVPKASRKQRPIYIGANPITGTYKRRNEGDYSLDEIAVKRMLADQVEDSADSKILKGYSLADLDKDTLAAYRSTFAALKPTHPFIAQDIPDFLRSIGACGVNRETGTDGLTVAGLLMFGKLRSILDEYPYYVLDYRERPEAKAENRWVDRVTTDGSWSGNLYDFYRRTYQKLTADLKVPFQLQGSTRIDETPVHEALREALVNALIHSDYSGRASVLIVKRPDMFGFRNPGLMRVSIEQALHGGDSDCRNRNVQKMFQFIGAGEQAGSGIPKIYQNWKQQHWRQPKITEKPEPEQTLFELHMASLLPHETIQRLDSLFGERFRKLPELERIALVTADTESLIDHKRLSEITKEHPADISKALSSLARDGFLRTDGSGRGTHYYVTGAEVDKLINGSNSIGLEQSSLGLEQSSLGLNENSSDISSEELEISSIARKAKKMNRTQMEDIILRLCSLRPQPIERLAKLLNRDSNFIRNDYLRALIKNDRLELLYPEKRNHPQQAYKTVN